MSNESSGIKQKSRLTPKNQRNFDFLMQLFAPHWLTIFTPRLIPTDFAFKKTCRTMWSGVASKAKNNDPGIRFTTADSWMIIFKGICSL